MIAQSTGNEASVERRFVPDGPFDLATQNTYFGGWVTSAQDPGEIVMAFPVEGWAGRCRRPAPAGRHGRDRRERRQVVGFDLDAGWRQALAVLSLDADGGAYADVGQRDHIVGSLQEEHHYLRPVLFHSPYEAACHFVLAHRISAAQGRRIRQRMAEEHGDQLSLGMKPAVSAFPTPHQLLAVSSVPGVPAEKIGRLHAIARAALEGLLDRGRLRELPVEEACRTPPASGDRAVFFSDRAARRGPG